MTIRQIQAEHVLPAQATLGEGPIWDPRCSAYWWIDIVEKKLFCFDPTEGSNRAWELDQMPGTVVPRARGGLVLALQDGFGFFDPDSGRLSRLGDPETDKPDNRFNDGKCDPGGRFWAGTMRIDDHMEVFTGSLYSLETDLSIVKRLGDDIGVSNGIVWSSDGGSMYFVDSPRREIYRFDYDLETGKIRNRTTIFRATQQLGCPDGMAIDAEDKLWVAFWGGACVARICPQTGTRLAEIRLPVSAITACAFGGRELDRLLITTASVGLSAAERQQQPLAGDLFIAEVGVSGAPQSEFAG